MRRSEAESVSLFSGFAQSCFRWRAPLHNAIASGVLGLVERLVGIVQQRPKARSGQRGAGDADADRDRQFLALDDRRAIANLLAQPRRAGCGSAETTSGSRGSVRGRSWRLPIMYIVVEDGNITEMRQDADHESGPARSVTEFLQGRDDADQIDAAYCDRYGRHVTGVGSHLQRSEGQNRGWSWSKGWCKSTCGLYVNTVES